MSNFDWYSEEDIGWDEEARPTARPPRPPRRWRRWLLLLLIVIVGAGTAVTTVYQRLSQRVEEVSYALEADIRDSYGIVYKSALEADRDLFVTFLSGRNAAWAGAQERVVAAGLYYARPGFGLQWLPGDAETAVTGVTIDPTLTAAVVTATHQYALAVGNGLSQTIMLQQTATYRLGPDRWLLSPPALEFWGETETSKGSLLTLTYPQRDAAIANRLAVDLEAKINELCANLADVNCPDDLQVNVSLSANPAAIFESNQLPSNLTITVPRMRTLGWYSFPARLGEHTLTLPTPSLLGMPLDEMGYQAIYRGYAARVVSAVIAEQVGWQCCDGAVLFQALLDVQLAQLSLKPWSVTAADYETVLGTPVTAVYETWRDVQLDFDDGRLPLYVMVDFLTQDVGVAVATMQRALVDAPAEQWLRRVVEDVYPNRAYLERGWRHYLYGRSQIAQTPPPIPWPQQDLLLVCRPLDFANALLYRYDPAADALTVARALGRETAVLMPVPQTSAVLIGEQGGGASPFVNTFLWQPAGREILIDRQSTAGGAAALPLALSPDEKLATFFVAGRNVIPYTLLNLDACHTTGRCDLQSLLGRPIWSPDGLHTLLVGNAADDDTLLFLGDALGQNVDLVGEGQHPFWLDDKTVVYVSGREVMAVNTADLTTQTLLTIDEALAALPAAQTADWQLDFAGVSPQAPDVLLLALSDHVGMGHLLAYEMQRGLVTERLSWPQQEDVTPAQYRFALNGRWLAIVGFGGDELGWQLFLHDVVQDVTRTYALGTAVPGEVWSWLNWSADGQWAAVANDGYVRLLVPEANYERWFIPDRMACDQAVWSGERGALGDGNP